VIGAHVSNAPDRDVGLESAYAPLGTDHRADISHGRDVLARGFQRCHILPVRSASRQRQGTQADNR
jgi:hypothetical protein